MFVICDISSGLVYHISPSPPLVFMFCFFNLTIWRFFSHMAFLSNLYIFRSYSAGQYIYEWCLPIFTFQVWVIVKCISNGVLFFFVHSWLPYMCNFTSLIFHSVVFLKDFHKKNPLTRGKLIKRELFQQVLLILKTSG